MGWTKSLELAKVARRDGQEFDCATWMHKARRMPKDQFRREVEKELTGKETEASELVYFKLYKSQIPVIEQAIETAALMLGSDKSRGYCLEMICADFLAGANLDNGDPETLLFSMTSILQASAKETKGCVRRESDREGVMSRFRPKVAPIRLDPISYERASPRGATPRWLALSILWHHVKFGSPSSPVSEPVRR